MPKPADDAGPVQINLRIPRDMLAELDARLAEINRSKRFGKTTRTSVFLGALEVWLREHAPVTESAAEPARRVEYDEGAGPPKKRPR